MAELLTLSEGEPAEEAHFSRLYLRSRSWLLPRVGSGLRFGGADSRPGWFILGCEPIQQELEVTDWNLPRTLVDPAEGVELVHWSTSRMKTTWLLLNPRWDYPGGLSSPGPLE